MGFSLNQNRTRLPSGWQEAFSPYLPWLLWAAGFLALPLVFSASPYWQRVVCMVCIYGLLALGFDFLAHHVGLVCLGGAFFIGVGGYLTAILNTHLGLPPLAAIPAATVLGAIFCTLVLYPCLSLKGIYFAIVSLMYPLLARRAIEALDILGGTEGIVGVEGFATSWAEQYVLILGLLLAFFALKRLAASDAGLVLMGIRDNEQAVKASAINITPYKALAVFLASALGCFAGAVLSHIYLWAGISLFALDFSHSSSGGHRGGRGRDPGRTHIGMRSPGAPFRTAAGFRPAQNSGLRRDLDRPGGGQDPGDLGICGPVFHQAEKRGG